MDEDCSPIYWCKFEAVSPYSYIMVCSIFIIQLVILVISICFFLMNFKSLNKQMQAYNRFYKILFIWLLFTLTHKSLNIISYNFLGINHNNNSMLETLKIVSSITLYFNYMSIFILHTILFKIPCIWLENLLTNSLQNLFEMNKEEDMYERIKTVEKYLKYVQKFGMYALSKGRILVFVGLYITMLVLMLTDIICEQSLFMNIANLIQSLINAFAYIAGYIFLRKSQKYMTYSSKLIRQVRVQYLALTICCLFNFSIYIMFFYFWKVEKYYDPNKFCYDDHDQTAESNKYFVRELAQFVFGEFSISCLPIFMVLWAYRPQKLLDFECFQGIGFCGANFDTNLRNQLKEEDSVDSIDFKSQKNRKKHEQISLNSQQKFPSIRIQKTNKFQNRQ